MVSVATGGAVQIVLTIAGTIFLIKWYVLDRLTRHLCDSQNFANFQTVE